MHSILLVAGEASGDDLASGVISHMAVPVWGVGGPRSVSAGLQALASPPNIMGFADVVAQGGQLLRLRSRVLEQAKRHHPSAALLVGFSDFNARLSRDLTQLRIPVVWYAPPQVWAWRRWRASPIASRATVLATLFDFEVDVWSHAGASVHHVGHPASLIDPGRRDDLRRARGMQRDTALILLPGSRRREVEQHTPTLNRAGALLRERGVVSSVALALSPSLTTDLQEKIRHQCAQHGIELVSGPAAAHLAAFDVAVCCSGTATLECVSAAVPPVIVYDAGPFTRAVARYVLRLPHIGLPNVLLGRRAFPELLGNEVRPETIVRAVRELLGCRPVFANDYRAIRERLSPKAGAGPVGSTPGERVASLLTTWLG